MAAQTEAACLLETGAMYPARLGLRDPSGRLVFAGRRPGVVSLYFDDAPIVHCDLEGRWQRAFLDGTHYLKALDTTVQAIERHRDGGHLVLRRRTLSFAETSECDATIRAEVLALAEAIDAGRVAVVAPPSAITPLGLDELRALLERIAAWDASAWFAHREHYLATYGPLPLLPPDCQHAVILQATLGHAEGRAFGHAPAVAHAVRTDPEFREHAWAVSRLLGRRVEQARTIFLAGSDVVRQPADTVTGYLQAIAEVFPIGSRDTTCLDGVHTLLDDVGPPQPDAETWALWRRHHLRQVDLGVESGDPQVRALYGKTWRDDDLRQTVAQLKQAGLGVGVLVLAGAGGVENAPRHLDATAALLKTLELGPGDLVSLLDADQVGGDSARVMLQQKGLTPASARMIQEQQNLMRKYLDPLRRERRVKVVPYNLDKQGA